MQFFFFFFLSHFQHYVAQSQWKICEHFKDGGKWRNLIVRSNKENHLMIIAIIHPQDLGQTEIHEEMLRMKDYMVGCSISENLKSIYYQAWYKTVNYSFSICYQLIILFF